MKTYEAEPAMLAEVTLLAQQHRLADGAQDAVGMKRIERQYHEVLARFDAAGWAGAVGEEHELPDAAMPAAYLARRAQILDGLENELGRLAIAYRSAPTPLQMAQAVAAYEAVFNEMCRIGHWHGEPDSDAQLPLDDMPALYKQMRNEWIREYRAQQATPGSVP